MCCCAGDTKKTEYKESELNPEWNEVRQDKLVVSIRVSFDSWVLSSGRPNIGLGLGYRIGLAVAEGDGG